MRKAFTLIELLVVVAIIAILAAILFPVFAQAKAAAKRTVTLSNVKQVVLASRMYATDSDDVYSMSMDGWNLPPGSEQVAYLQIVRPYTKGPLIHWNGLDPIAGNLKMTMTPPAGQRSWGTWTFGTTIAPNEVVLERWTGNQYVPRSESEYRNPAALMMFAPFRGFTPGFGSVDFVPVANVCVWGLEDASAGVVSAARLHGDGIFAGYADGHAGRKSLGIVHVRSGILVQDPDCVAWRKREDVDEFFGTYLDTFYPVPN